MDVFGSSRARREAWRGKRVVRDPRRWASRSRFAPARRSFEMKTNQSAIARVAAARDVAAFPAASGFAAAVFVAAESLCSADPDDPTC